MSWMLDGVPERDIHRYKDELELLRIELEHYRQSPWSGEGTDIVYDDISAEDFLAGFVEALICMQNGPDHLAQSFVKTCANRSKEIFGEKRF